MKVFLSKAWIFILLVCAKVHAEPLFVSLGSHCEIAGHLRENGLRARAFPFDWLVSLNSMHLVQLLEEDFARFLNPSYFVRDPEHLDRLENSAYTLEFRHDWSFADFRFDVQRGEKQFDELVHKYSRRIARFRELRAYKDTVFFLRCDYDYQNGGHTFWWDEQHAHIDFARAKALKEALDRFFPHLSFMLILVQYAEDEVEPIEGIEGVRTFMVRKSHKHEDYKSLFGRLRL